MYKGCASCCISNSCTCNIRSRGGHSLPAPTALSLLPAHPPCPSFARSSSLSHWLISPSQLTSFSRETSSRAPPFRSSYSAHQRKPAEEVPRAETAGREQQRVGSREGPRTEDSSLSFLKPCPNKCLLLKNPEIHSLP